MPIIAETNDPPADPLGGASLTDPEYAAAHPAACVWESRRIPPGLVVPSYGTARWVELSDEHPAKTAAAFLAARARRLEALHQPGRLATEIAAARAEQQRFDDELWAAACQHMASYASLVSREELKARRRAIYVPPPRPTSPDQARQQAARLGRLQAIWPAVTALPGRRTEAAG